MVAVASEQLQYKRLAHKIRQDRCSFQVERETALLLLSLPKDDPRIEWERLGTTTHEQENIQARGYRRQTLTQYSWSDDLDTVKYERWWQPDGYRSLDHSLIRFSLSPQGPPSSSQPGKHPEERCERTLSRTIF